MNSDETGWIRPPIPRPAMVYGFNKGENRGFLASNYLNISYNERGNTIVFRHSSHTGPAARTLVPPFRYCIDTVIVHERAVNCRLPSFFFPYSICITEPKDSKSLTYTYQSG